MKVGGVSLQIHAVKALDIAARALERYVGTDEHEARDRIELTQEAGIRGPARRQFPTPGCSASDCIVLLLSTFLCFSPKRRIVPAET